MNAARRPNSWFVNLPVQSKMVLALGSVLLLLLLSCVAFFSVQREQDDARNMTRHSYEVILGIELIGRAARAQQTGVRDYLITADKAYLDTYASGRKDFQAKYAELRRQTAEDPNQQARLRSIDELMAKWQAEFGDKAVALVGHSTIGDQAAALFAQGASKAYMDDVADILVDMDQAEQVLLAERERRLQRTVERARLLIFAVMALGILIVAAAVLLTSRLVTRPIVEMTGLMTRLADHDHAIEVPWQTRRNEIGAIARALQAFKQMAIESHAQNWVKSNVAEIAGRLQQAGTPKEFAQELTGMVAPLLDCGLAVFYRSDELSGRVDSLGSYGFRDRSAAPLSYLPGEGLVGQCVQQRMPVLLRNIPETYTRIHSGLGAAAPRQVLLLPLIQQSWLLGVLELASFEAFTPQQRRLLDELMPIAALTFDNLQRALRTRTLLEESQTRSEELKIASETLHAQQEELRATNDALNAKTALLQEQSARLQASEEELKLQAEELQVSNEELTEKSATLHEQKLILEQLQRDTQDKADALARASQYKSEFLANMSHELRTPLNSLLILSRSLADNEAGHLDGEEVESAQVIHDSGSKLLKLINDILDLSKVEAGKMEIVVDALSLRDFADTMTRNFRPVARDRTLAFDIEVADGLPEFIHTDAGRLEQIANNLLGNAFKFTRQGSVRVRIQRPAADMKLPEGLAGDAAIAIVVSDTGIGIAPDKQHRMFQVFEQADAGTSRQYGGTGLGLSIARGMAQLLGGDILLQSELGQGSAFTLIVPEQSVATVGVALPVSEFHPEAKDEMRLLPPTAALTLISGPVVADDRALIEDGDTTILVIEDDPVFGRILADLIRRKGYRVLVAADGEGGLALARRFQPSGVLLDVMLPGMDGWTVLDRFKSELKLRSIPVHFISATEDAARGIEAGAIGFLTKPVSKNSLLEAFERLLQNVPGTTRRILLVDDDAPSRQTMHNLLAEAGIELVDAASGEDALVLLAASRFDCVVLDLGLPGISGYEFLEQASLNAPLPPVVIHSGRELSREESLKLRQYTDSIVIKGVRSPERLLDEVSLFLHSIRPAAMPAAAREHDASLGGRTVLVVDDDMRNIFAMSKALRAKGLKVLMAQDGKKALKQLEDNRSVELVLMDIMMPGMDGYDTMREIRRRAEHQSLPIIALTAKAMLGDREKCLDAGANDYLSKPIDVDKLMSMMRVWVRPRA